MEIGGLLVVPYMRTKILVCETVIVPDYVTVPSKSGDSPFHKVIRETVYGDPICDCKGYLWRGKCSHIDQVQEARCMWWTKNLDYNGVCPNCGANVMEWEV